MKSIFVFFLIILSTNFAFGQASSSNEILWNKSIKLTSEDFLIKSDNYESPIKSTFNISWQLMGFSVMNKNFNQNVKNTFFKNTSVINPGISNLVEAINYQQLNFDMAEIYARKMRKDLFLNKSKLWKGFDFANEILNERLHEFYSTQLLMDKETNRGAEPSKIKVWRDLIDAELKKTEQFDYYFKGKIKIVKETEGNFL